MKGMDSSVPKPLTACAVSVIVPFFNEEGNLPALAEALRPVLNQFAPASEVLLINDGSTDQSEQAAHKIAERDPRFKLITFRRNFGQTAGWAAGIDYASGDVLVFMDADMQNDPADIPMLVSRMNEGQWDVVSGWRQNRRDAFWKRRVPSVLANRLISAVTGCRLHDYGCSLKAYRADMIKNVRLYGEMHRFLPAYAAAEGCRILEVPVRHHPRRIGKSKYGLSRTFKVLLDLVTVLFLGGFSTKPLYAFGGIGGASLAGGAISFCIVAYRALVLGRKQATPMIFLMVIFVIAGIQFIMLGLLAELAVRTYHEAQAKPIYRIKGLTNLQPARRRRRLF